mmetsp:Transcript_6923/g.6191  ORF Transcript_6923/g.6191 Transcript_6923/m.6191 type:complete len:203 (-) Transcript_6923:370-978(-)
MEDSEFWTPDMRNRVVFTNSDDGMFCMTLKDFMINFAYMDIGYHDETWEYVYLECNGDPKHARYFKFELRRKTSIYVRIHQDDNRGISPDAKVNFQYSPVELWVTKVEDDGDLVPIVQDTNDLDPLANQGARVIYPCKDRRLDLKEGKYIIRVKVKWRDNKVHRYTLSAYSDKKLSIKETVAQDDFVEKYLISIAKSAKNKM